MIRLLTFGTVSLDTLETPSGTVVDAPGGSALYAAAAAAASGRVRATGPVGHDYPLGRLEPLQGAGVDLGGLRPRDAPSLRWHARYAADGERTVLGADKRILEDFELRMSAEEAAARGVLVGSIRPALQLQVISQLTQDERPLSGLDSMSHWIASSRDAVLDALGRVDVYFGSEEEVALLSGIPNPDDAARRLLDMGPYAVVVKRGGAGASVMSRQITLDCGAPHVDAIDPTGAGDALAGAFMATLVEMGATSPFSVDELSQALSAGVAAGAAAVRQFGLSGILDPTWPEPDQVRLRS